MLNRAFALPGRESNTGVHRIPALALNDQSPTLLADLLRAAVTPRRGHELVGGLLAAGAGGPPGVHGSSPQNLYRFPHPRRLHSKCPAWPILPDRTKYGAAPQVQRPVFGSVGKSDTVTGIACEAVTSTARVRVAGSVGGV